MAIHGRLVFLLAVLFGAGASQGQFGVGPVQGIGQGFGQGPGGNNFGNPPGGNPLGGEAGAGGGSIADFDSLMNLVQSVIEPDSWEALGGVGTMAPYPAGIVVDPSGLVSTAPVVAPESVDASDRLRGLLPSGDANRSETHWRDPAKVRCVSLRRMMQTIAASVQSGVPTPDDLQSLAGLSRVSLVLMTHDDVILAGEVGGFVNRDGWWIDRLSGLPPIRLTSLALGLTACRTGTPFGCTIDPKTESLQAAAAVTQRVSGGAMPIGLAAEALAEALGRQDVRVFGTSANHEAAWVMIEADRHMKQLALGVESMPEGTRNLLQTIQTSGSPPPTDLLLRLWFTGQPIAARTAHLQSDRLIELAGVPIRLSGENELALLSGERGNRVLEPTTQTFVDHFNANWSSLQSAYPIYGALESIYQSAAIAQLWTSSLAGDWSDASETTRRDYAVMQSAIVRFAALSADQLTLPRETDSIAVMHRYRRRNQMHHLVMASGGVSVNPSALVPPSLVSYPSLASQSSLKDARPSDRWWWNAVVVAPH